MKLTVKISRNDYGVLEAHVIQDGQKGANLLPSRCMSSVLNGRIKIAQKLRGCEIEWAGLTPDSDSKTIESKAFWNPRDGYGWKSL